MLLHVVPVSTLGSLIGCLVNEITGIAPWQPTRSATSSVPCDASRTCSPHVVISVDSLRPRVSARATRGGQALSSQSSALSSQASQHRPTQPGGDGNEEDAGHNAAPACFLIQIDQVTGDVKVIRRLVFFDVPGGGGESSRDASGGSSVTQHTVREWQAVAARCTSVSCNSRHVAAGFPSGTVGVWSTASARLVALLRDPQGISRGGSGGGAAGGARSRGRPLSSQQTGGGGVRCVTCVAMHPTLRIVVAGRSDGVIDIWASQ